MESEKDLALIIFPQSYCSLIKPGRGDDKLSTEQVEKEQGQLR